MSDSSPFNWVSNRLLSVFGDGSPLIFLQSERGNENSLRISIVFFPPSFESILNRSLHESRNRDRPVSSSAMKKLTMIPVKSPTHFPDDCTVCQESINKGDIAAKLPCSHIYHKSCILPWFESHNSCPVCRYELPVDDPDEERQRKLRMEERDRELANKPKLCELVDFTECIHCNATSTTTSNNNSDTDVSPPLEALSSCGHLFHPKCIEKWSKKHSKENHGILCPVCNVVSVSKNNSSKSEHTGPMTRSKTRKRAREELSNNPDASPKKKRQKVE